MSLKTHIEENCGLTLKNFLKQKNKYYHKFLILKRSGASREILAPAKELKEAQRYILNHTLIKYSSHNIAHGFQRGRSVRTNAKIHEGAQVLLNIDIKDFFPSIHSKTLNRTLKMLNIYDTEKIIDICTYNYRLPQGAVTSPWLSNLVLYKLDEDLNLLAERNNCKVTRYCDDITFSSMDIKFPIGKLIKEVRKLLSYHKFKLNYNKLRILRPHKRLEITGVVINEKLSISRKYRRNLRAQIHNYTQTTNKSKKEYEKIQGKLAWINSINPTQATTLRKKLSLIDAKR